MRRVGGMPMLTQADALRLPLADDSVDLVVTSPPYFALRSYRDGDEHYDGQIGSEATPQDFLEALWAATAEMVRVVKPSGSIFVNLGDKYATNNPHQDGQRRSNRVGYKSLMGLPWRYAIGCIDDLGLILRAEIVWSKPNGLPESVTDRVRRSHEQWFHFTLEPRYFSATDEIREPWAVASRNGRGAGKTYTADGSANHGVGSTSLGMVGADVGHPQGKLPGSVWSIPSEPLQVPDSLGVDHFAAFPQEWPRRLILGWSPSDGVVLDPFAGTGTVPMVARALGRTGVGVDLSADYLKLANWRVFQSGHAAKTMRRTNQERQGQLL
jgi:DNA modification methylase